MSSFIKIIQPSDFLNGVQVKQLRHQISDLVASGVDIILINFENVKQIDSSGLGGLIAIQRVVRTANSKVFLCSIHGQVKMLFDLTKMHEIFQVFANQQEFQEEVLNQQKN